MSTTPETPPPLTIEKARIIVRLMRLDQPPNTSPKA